MNATLIVLALVVLGVAIVVWLTRRKPDATRTGPREGDTAWNDPVTPGEPARSDAAAETPPHSDPRP